MKVEPFQIKGKTISEAFMAMTKDQEILFIKFTDGTIAEVYAERLEDEISGNMFPGKRIEIELNN